ncbi:hypothetical protein Back11_21170 [Paenibacillus baekrokdamisoli]|uniref:Uncharacterized protein n=1 Tax=Paenibacillus baekrokdamisoli TaxID=1712516 RepID=A0A3G9IR63_9BACL|nr:hypothetical protein [Paenibacillus baekrokdamisoli]MBB3069874.1 putative membrane protein [Paenibacillus baekrokdamisoli]BBH20772.1 hypothetical protein Back11_21170 [Paenibacillus baekrokdamisoli]
MILMLSMVLLVGCTGYTIMRIYKHRQLFSCMAGMMIAMTIGMIASIAFGTLIGLLYRPDLTTPTIAAVLFGMVCGYLSGKPIRLIAALDGMLAGIMGGMMGAMLGVMIESKGTVIVLFIDVVFIFVLLVLHQFISEESSVTRQSQEIEERAASRLITNNNQSKGSILHPLVFGVVIFAVAAVFLYQNSDNQITKPEEPTTHDHSSAK